jgi:hypothetical protein
LILSNRSRQIATAQFNLRRAGAAKKSDSVARSAYTCPSGVQSNRRAHETS